MRGGATTRVNYRVSQGKRRNPVFDGIDCGHGQLLEGSEIDVDDQQRDVGIAFIELRGFQEWLTPTNGA